MVNSPNVTLTVYYASASGVVSVITAGAIGTVPVAGATVTIGTFSSVTDSAGRATFANIPQPGTYPFSVTAAGHPTYNGTLNFSGAAGTFAFQILLS